MICSTPSLGGCGWSLAVPGPAMPAVQSGELYGEMKVINLFAGPGAGKTTIGAVLFGMLKMAGYEAEFVPEFVKIMHWANARTALEDELYLFSKQAHRLHVLRRQPLDFVVMDGPLLNALVYQPADYFPSFPGLVLDVFRSYDNVNFFIERVKPYSPLGRSQDEPQARTKCKEIAQMLDDLRVPLAGTIPGDERAAGRIFALVTGKQPQEAPRLA